MKSLIAAKSNGSLGNNFNDQHSHFLTTLNWWPFRWLVRLSLYSVCEAVSSANVIS